MTNSDEQIQVIPEAAVDAAWDTLLERGLTQSSGIDYAGLAAALEAAAPHMAGYRWPLGDDDNPHRGGDVQPRGGAK